MENDQHPESYGDASQPRRDQQAHRGSEQDRVQQEAHHARHPHRRVAWIPRHPKRAPQNRGRQRQSDGPDESPRPGVFRLSPVTQRDQDRQLEQKPQRQVGRM